MNCREKIIEQIQNNRYVLLFDSTDKMESTSIFKLVEREKRYLKYESERGVSSWEYDYPFFDLQKDLRQQIANTGQGIYGTIQDFEDIGLKINANKYSKNEKYFLFFNSEDLEFAISKDNYNVYTKKYNGVKFIQSNVFIRYSLKII